MNEEIEYAEMLEIPVSTVNVVKKAQRRRKKAAQADVTKVMSAPNASNASSVSSSMGVADMTATASATQAAPFFAEETGGNPLKDSVIAQVNDRLGENAENIIPSPTEIKADADLFAESANSEGRLDFDPIPERIDTVRLYATEEKTPFRKRHEKLRPQEYFMDEYADVLEEDFENDGGRYASNDENDGADGYRPMGRNTPSKAMRIALGTEFALACALCGAIFLTNVFMPSSAINTFFRALGEPKTDVTDVRAYTDFTLSPVVSELSDAELNLSAAGILSFTDECCVYPAADGKISELTQEADGTYRVKISHSDSFTGVISGLDRVYYEVGDSVKANVPMGYSDGEAEVQVTMYSQGVLLNCFQLTEENCLAWVAQE